MKVIVDGANYQDTGLGQVVVDSVKNELISVYGAGNVTDEKVFAVQRLMSRLGWGLEYGIYPKLKFLMLPFMCGGVANTSAFWDLVSKEKKTVGAGSYVVTDSNIGDYWTFDSYGCYPKKNADSNVTANGIIINEIRATCSEFALFRRTGNQQVAGKIMSNAAGSFNVPNVGQDAITTVRYNGAGNTNYFSCNVSGAIPGLGINNIHVIVNTGTGAFATEKIVTDLGECFYASQTGSPDDTGRNYEVSFGSDHTFKNSDATEMLTFAVMGFAVGLDVDEARIVRDALVELKNSLAL